MSKFDLTTEWLRITVVRINIKCKVYRTIEVNASIGAINDAAEDWIVFIDTIDALCEVDKHYSSMIQAVTSTANSRFHARADWSLIFILLVLSQTVEAMDMNLSLNS